MSQFINNRLTFIITSPQYSRGEEIGGYTAKRANRFIFSRDIANGEMQAVQCLTGNNLFL